VKINIKIKNWDSDFFKIRIAEASVYDFKVKNFRDLKELFLRDEIELVYLYPEDAVSDDSLSHLELFTDTKLVFRKSLIKRNVSMYQQNLINDNLSDYMIDEGYHTLLELAFSSGIFSRFRLDPGFRNNEFERLYTEWLNQSINKTIADKVIVIRRQNNEITGFITFKESDSTSKIGLIAVSEKERGKGIGKKLLDFVEAKALDSGLEEIIVETQERNVSAVNFYIKNSFSLIKKIRLYHLWTRF
jgi:dTDP-4-amino-4,6-dideoxy-D-galactose acyltransferase